MFPESRKHWTSRPARQLCSSVITHQYPWASAAVTMEMPPLRLLSQHHSYITDSKLRIYSTKSLVWSSLIGQFSQQCSLGNEVCSVVPHRQTGWVRSHIHLCGGDVVPPGGSLAGEFSHLQLIWRLVHQIVERTHCDDPGQVKTAHLDTNTHLDKQRRAMKPEGCK